jgi:2-oxoglutarate dehydrogenase E2 component (dihydrolipoamide succinyltransferase)
MAINIVVPELGESVVEATISQWRKKAGDPVAAGEAVVDLETEKVNLEVAAERAGVLARIDKQAGEDVRVGEVIGSIEPQAAEAASAGIDKPPAKATEEAKAAPVAVEQAAKAAAAAPAAGANGDRATPVARRLAEEKGIDLAQVPATGSGGRITRQDVEEFLKQPAAEATAPLAAASAAPAPPVPASSPTPSVSAPTQPTLPVAVTKAADSARGEERVRMSRRRRTIARRLVEAQQTAAMLTTFNEIDLGAVMDIRKRRKESFKAQHGVGLGFMSFFVKASIGALKAFPALNAEIQEDEIIYKHYYDIGMAIGSPEGLVVPVLRDADRMSFAEIEKSVDALVQKAQQSTLTLDDLRGGTFTITNGGVFGSLMSTPILNPPQVGILGLHKIEDRPVARDGAVVIRPMMYVALSYDHRLVDGREAVQFLVRVKQLIEDPETLLLEG